jgi:hypothetical protein
LERSSGHQAFLFLFSLQQAIMISNRDHRSCCVRRSGRRPSSPRKEEKRIKGEQEAAGRECAVMPTLLLLLAD